MSEVHTEIHVSEPGPVSSRAEDPALQLLQQQLDLLYARIEAESDTLTSRMESELWSGFQAAWQAAVESHQELAKEVLLDEPESGAIGWKEIIQYRRDVHRFIFLKTLSSLMPSIFSRIESILQQFFTRMRAIESELPMLIQVPENPDLFTPHPSDSARDRFRKWIRRRRQQTLTFGHGCKNVFRRITFREPKALPERTQNIPYKHLAGYHLGVRIPESIQPAIYEIHQVLTAQLAKFEHAQTLWLHTLLEAEHKAYQPSIVLDSSIRWPVDTDTEANPLLEAADIQRVTAHVHQLDSALVFESAPWSDYAQSIKDAIQNSFDLLLYDINRGGTLLLSAAERPIPDMTPRSGLNEHWRLWHEEVLQRAQMNNELLKFRDRLLSSNQSLVKQIHKDCLAPVIDSYTSLQEHISSAQIEVKELCEAAKDADDLKPLGHAISNVREALMNDFKSVLENVHVLVKTGKALEETGQLGWTELNRYVDTIERIISVHNPLPSPPALKKIQSGRYEVRLGELIESSVSDGRTSRLSGPSTSLRKALFKAWGDLQEVQNIVDFNLTAAVSELTETKEEPDPEESQEEETTRSQDPLADAEKLISEALTRSKENLAELLSELHAPWDSFLQESFKLTNRYWRTIKEDLRSQDQIHSWWENAFIFASRALSRFVSNLAVIALAARAAIFRFGNRLKTLFLRLVQKGQSAVGVIEQSEEQWLHTLNRVSKIKTLYDTLPLIYQPLFSRNPLTELDLIEGRKKDLDYISNHYERWLKGQMGPLVLSMVEGSGRTSLMNVLHRTTFKDGNVHRVVLNKRIDNTALWAERIAAVLGIPAVKSLEHLESLLVPRTRSKSPDVIILDQFEHLLLCTPGGDDVLERILIFMSRTDHLIYWVANINKHAWHYLENTIHPSFGFITAYTASTISRQAIEDIILKRHHRSGLTLRFDSSIRLSRLRQLTSSRDDKSRQRDLRRVFFDRLYKLCGENIRLAILYWLQSVRYDKQHDTLFVHNIHPINFAFLDTLDLKRAFTLKTLMVHGTLTLDEHMKLFNMNQTESTFILESLLNLRIIEPTVKKGEPDQQVHIIPETSYRLHSLIRHPVSEYLSREHIIY